MVAVTGANKKKVNKDKCIWKDCSPGTHPKGYMPYDNNGVIKKEMFKEKVHPSIMYSKLGIKVKGYYIPYRTKKNRGKDASNYWYQRHHIVPGNMRKKLKKLFHNLKLMGWNINGYPGNYMPLPTLDVDIVWHDLQSHRGCHPKYDIEMYAMLESLQTDSLSFCKNAEANTKGSLHPKHLINELNENIDFAAEMILNWDPAWLLVTTSWSKRLEIFFTLSDAKSGMPFYPKRTLANIK